MTFINDTLDQINWFAVVLATLSTMPVGYLWYDMKLGFGKRWAELNGLSKEEIESPEGMPQIFGVMLLTSFVTAFLMAGLILATGTDGFIDVLMFGLIFGLVFRSGAHFIHNGFAKKPLELTLIDTGHDLFSVTAMALIVGLWQ